jgi:hypothetical protein
LEELPITAIPTSAFIDSPELVNASLNKDGRVQRSSGGGVIGKLDERARACLFKMADEEGIRVQLLVKLKPAGAQRIRKQKTGTVAYASAILYGPADIGDDIGAFLDKCKYNLQDPFGCEDNVPYRNPHCISTLLDGPGSSIMTFDLQGVMPRHCLPERSAAESLAALETTETLPEWQQPTALRTLLYR